MRHVKNLGCPPLLPGLLQLIAGTEFAAMTLEQIVKAAAGKPDRIGLFNNAAQVWNHSFGSLPRRT